MPKPSYLMSFTADETLAKAIADACEAEQATSAAAWIRAVLCKHLGLPIVSPRRLKLTPEERQALVRREEAFKSIVDHETPAMIESKARDGSALYQYVADRLAIRWR